MARSLAQFTAETLFALGDLPFARGDVLDQLFACDRLQRRGTWLEFGVAGGASLRRLAAERGEAQLWGFDSFEGLPEAWNELPVGHFSQGGRPPTVEGACLVKGRFEDSIGPWLEDHAHLLAADSFPVTLLHIDCDLYASARFVLEAIHPYLAPRAIVVFDELVGYDGFEEHEMRALWEATEVWEEPLAAWRPIARSRVEPWQAVAIELVR